MVDFKDFHKVQDMHFDIPKLKKGLVEVLKVRNYDSANGIPNFAAICLIKFLEIQIQQKEIMLEEFFGQNRMSPAKKFRETFR